jgi:hypothetical protein
MTNGASAIPSLVTAQSLGTDAGISGAVMVVQTVMKAVGALNERGLCG